MITFSILCAGKGTVKEKIQMIFTSLCIDSTYILPIIL